VLTDDAPPAPDREPLTTELVDHVAAQLAPHKRPRTVYYLDELPRNDLGKVQKKRLAAPDRT
jgi:malonyl-CoA/methylmalonyl-CoA synthetase